MSYNRNTHKELNGGYTMTKDFEVFQRRVEVDYKTILEQLPFMENISFLEKGYKIAICDLAYRIFISDLENCEFDLMVLLYYDKPITAFYEFFKNNQGNLADGCMRELESFIVYSRKCISDISNLEETTEDMQILHKRYVEYISSLT